MNKDDFERMKNFALFKIWATDKEMDKIWPILPWVFLVLLILFVVFAII